MQNVFTIAKTSKSWIVGLRWWMQRVRVSWFSTRRAFGVYRILSIRDNQSLNSLRHNIFNKSHTSLHWRPIYLHCSIGHITASRTSSNRIEHHINLYMVRIFCSKRCWHGHLDIIGIQLPLPGFPGDNDKCLHDVWIHPLKDDFGLSNMGHCANFVQVS